jgi:hypothetical protein
VIWLLAAADLCAGLYLLHRAVVARRPASAAGRLVGWSLVACAVLLAGIGIWTAAAGPSAEERPTPGGSVLASP